MTTKAQLRHKKKKRVSIIKRMYNVKSGDLVVLKDDARYMAANPGAMAVVRGVSMNGIWVAWLDDIGTGLRHRQHDGEYNVQKFKVLKKNVILKLIEGEDNG